MHFHWHSALIACGFILTCHGQDIPAIVKHFRQHPVNPVNISSVEGLHEIVTAYEGIKSLSLDTIKDVLLQSNGSDPDQCAKDLAYILISLDTAEVMSAITMLDAVGKLPTGVLQGLFNWMGSYDQCVGTKLGNFTGRYCVTALGKPVKTQPPPGATPTSVTVGLCIPSTCNLIQIQETIDELVHEVQPVNQSIFAFGGYCQPLAAEVPGPKGWGVVLIVIFSILGMLIVLGTLYDIGIHQRRVEKAESLKQTAVQADPYPDMEQPADVDVHQYTPILNNTADTYEGRQSPIVKLGCSVLLAFSLPHNLGKLFHVPPAGEGNLAVIHGIRFLSMTWVILGHTFFFILNYVANPSFAVTLFNRWTFQALLSATVSVDSFFVLSGTLTAYLLFKELDKKGGIRGLGLGWIVFYVHRYWRLTPSYMLLVGFWTTLYQFLGEGPNWPGSTVSGKCSTSWWTNLLYVNNVVDQNDQCFGWAWYLANDMQFYIISPVFLIPLYIMWPVGLLAMGGTLLASLLATGFISSHYDIPLSFQGLISFPTAGGMEFFNKIYIVPWTRIGPYLVGLTLGWLLWRTKLKCKMHWALVTFGWVVSAALALAVVYGPYNVIKGHKPTTELSAFYNSVHRTVWGACLAWVIFACLNGYGGIVNRLLTWSALVPLSRLTYMAYLVHPMVIYFFYFTRQSLILVDDLMVIYLFLGHLALSYMVALVVSMALEAPMMGIEKVLLKKTN